MSFEPNPKQAFVLWKLLITQEMPVKSKLWPELTQKELTQLEKAGLIRIVERKKLRQKGLTDLKGRANHIILTDQAWDWALDNFNVELYSSKYTKHTIHFIKETLALIEAKIKLDKTSLKDFLKSLGKSILDLNDTPTTLKDLEEKIREAYSKVSEGSYNVRVRLSELRQHLGDLPRTEIDEKLGEMELAGKLSLMPLDDPQDIHPEDEKAAIDLGGPKRHILYMKG